MRTADRRYRQPYIFMLRCDRPRSWGLAGMQPHIGIGIGASFPLRITGLGVATATQNKGFANHGLYWVATINDAA